MRDFPRAVDLGARNGAFAQALAASDAAPRVGLLVEADLSGRMLAGRSGMRVLADEERLPFAPASLDGAIVAFGIRNVDDLDAGLREVRRVLRPGARFVILEFSTPRFALVRAAYLAYFHHVLPFIGRLVSGHTSAYTYLPMSVANFPTEETLAERMRAAGFSTVTWERLTLGIAAIHTGTV